VRPGVDVDTLDRLGDRARSGIRLAHVGRFEPRRGGRGGELAAELAEDEVLRALLDETGRPRPRTPSSRRCRG
jgi:hypothetical protein